MNKKSHGKFFGITIFVLVIAMMLPVFAVNALSEAASVDRAFGFNKAEMEGKSFVFYGDSITAGLGVPDADKRYINYLSEEFGFYAYNGAVSGASLTQVSTGTNDIYSQLEISQCLYRDADYISIFLGTNDFGMSRPLGTKDDAPGTDTVYASLKNVLNIITEANPDAKIMLLTPLFRKDGGNDGFDKANGVGYTLADVREAIKTVGAEYNCKVVDLTAVVDAGNYTSMLNDDKLHVREAGYRAMAECIKNS